MYGMNVPYTKPQINISSFHCPHCYASSSVTWSDLYYSYLYKKIGEAKTAQCNHCGGFSLWYGGQMIYPNNFSVEAPNSDLPSSVAKDYIEAAHIVSVSPRASAAILRLAIEKLVDHLGAEGTDLNVKIGYLVKKKNFNPKIQKSLDIVRVIGNHAVHAGMLDIADSRTTAEKMFVLINLIAAEMITSPKEVDAMYSELVPEKSKADIVRLDKK